jgi:monoamine oxidase
MPPRVVIIGAGPSGLAAADRLGARGADVTVLECAARVGGRTYSVSGEGSSGAVVDLGGQWVGAKQDALLSVVKELGLILHPQYTVGRRVLQLGSAITTYTGLIPNASVAVLVDAQLALLLLGLLQLLLQVCPCVRGGLSRYLDTMTAEAFCRRWMWTRGGRALVTVVVQALFGLEPADISVLALCRYVSASGGVEPMAEVGPGSLQAWTVLGGMMQVSEKLAARVRGRGHSILLSRRVSSVRLAPAGGSVVVTCETGEQFVADHVVVAIPPPLARHLTFEPRLGPARESLMADSVMGGIIKSVVVYKEAFWRSAGFSGEVVCDTGGDGERGGPAFNVFDGCVPHSEVGPPPLTTHRGGAAAGASVTAPQLGVADMVPALVVFINGQRAREWSGRPAEERHSAVLAQLARWFGPKALAPKAYLEHDWVADPNTKGCPIASYGRAVLTAYGLNAKLRAPGFFDAAGGGVYRLHFAGTETAEVGTGFVDGAIRAGWTAAEGVVNAATAAAKEGPGVGVETRGGGVQREDGGKVALLH